jgi:nitroreductase
MEFAEVVRRRRMVRNYDPDRSVPAEVVERMLRHAIHAPSAGFSQGWGFLVLESAADRERFWTATTPEDWTPAQPAGGGGAAGGGAGGGGAAGSGGAAGGGGAAGSGGGGAAGSGGGGAAGSGGAAGGGGCPGQGRWLAGMRRAPLIVTALSNKETYLDRYAEPDKGWTDRDESRWPVPYWHIDAGMAALLMLLTAVDAGLGACFFGIPPARIGAFRAEFGVPEPYTPVGALTVGYPAPDWRSPSVRRGRRDLTDVVHRGHWG